MVAKRTQHQSDIRNGRNVGAQTFARKYPPRDITYLNFPKSLNNCRIRLKSRQMLGNCYGLFSLFRRILRTPDRVYNRPGVPAPQASYRSVESALSENDHNLGQTDRSFGGIIVSIWRSILKSAVLTSRPAQPAQPVFRRAYIRDGDGLWSLNLCHHGMGEPNTSSLSLDCLRLRLFLHLILGSGPRSRNRPPTFQTPQYMLSRSSPHRGNTATSMRSASQISKTSANKCIRSH